MPSTFSDMRMCTMRMPKSVLSVCRRRESRVSPTLCVVCHPNLGGRPVGVSSRLTCDRTRARSLNLQVWIKFVSLDAVW